MKIPTLPHGCLDAVMALVVVLILFLMWYTLKDKMRLSERFRYADTLNKYGFSTWSASPTSTMALYENSQTTLGEGMSGQKEGVSFHPTPSAMIGVGMIPSDTNISGGDDHESQDGQERFTTTAGDLMPLLGRSAPASKSIMDMSSVMVDDIANLGKPVTDRFMGSRGYGAPNWSSNNILHNYMSNNDHLNKAPRSGSLDTRTTRELMMDGPLNLGAGRLPTVSSQLNVGSGGRENYVSRMTVESQTR